MIDEIVNNLQRIADRKCYPEDILDGSIAQEWVDYLTNLQQENKQLNEKIDKAIEYIKKHNIIGMNKEYLPSGIEKCYSVELLEILGEKENVKN